MRKTLVTCAIAFIAAFASMALSTTTWTTVTGQPSHIRCVQAWNPTSTGIEPMPVGTTAATEGLDLTGLESVEVFVETCTSLVGTTCNTAGGNMTAGGKLNAYIWNKAGGQWYPISDGTLDPVATATVRQGFAGYTVTADSGRIAFVPNGLGTTTRVIECGTKRWPPKR